MATIHVTAPRDAAPEIAKRLVEEGFAACVNRLECQSVYRCQELVHEDEEELLVVKTTEAAADAVVERIETLHPYDLPVVERVEREASPGVEEWIAASVSVDDEH